MSIRLKIGTLNVRGLRDNNKRRATFIWLRSKKLQVIFLQETHCTKQLETYWKSEWGGKAWFSSGTERARGVGILFD